MFTSSPIGAMWTEYGLYFLLVVAFSASSCLVTLTTKTIVPSAFRLATFDENLAAEEASDDANGDDGGSPRQQMESTETPPMVYYSAAGSGVAEVRVILSGFVLHGFLGLKTLIIKTGALILAVASGLSLGKEGPYVHIAACVGNITCRLFGKYDRNDAKRREVLSAAAAAGVAVAFGAPLGGVLFGLEEVSYFFPAKTLFRTFFCCIIASLTLKFLNPYGTHKIVMFEVRYSMDWAWFEIGTFVVVGMLGGAAGALFIKASKHWAKTFRRIKFIKKLPILEVVLVAMVTGVMNYWNVFTRLPVAKLLLNIASPCDTENERRNMLGLCPTSIDDVPPVLLSLFVGFLIKGFLTIITFGIVSRPPNTNSSRLNEADLTLSCRKFRRESICRPWLSVVFWAGSSATWCSGSSSGSPTGGCGQTAPGSPKERASNPAYTGLSLRARPCVASPGFRSRWPSFFSN